jgi:hypothetical protein
LVCVRSCLARCGCCFDVMGVSVTMHVLNAIDDCEFLLIILFIYPIGTMERFLCLPLIIERDKRVRPWGISADELSHDHDPKRECI